MDSTQKEMEFIAIYDEYADAIYRYCLINLHDKDMAKDITQETFIKAWKYMQAKSEIKHIKAFLYKIAKNLIIDNFRKKKTVSLDELNEAGFEVGALDENKIDQEIEGKSIMNALEKIAEKYREVLILRYVQDYSLAEIGGIMNKSENNVSVMLHRALKQVKNILKNEQ